MPKFGAKIDTSRLPIQGLMPEQAINDAAIASPVEGLIYHDITLKVVKVYLNGSWVTLGAAGAGGPPSGNAGGDLTGTYPNPGIAAGVIVLADLNTALTDGTAGSKQVRTLGTASTDAALGNHGHVLTGAEITGTLTTAKGGTNNAGPYVQGAVLYASTTTTIDDTQGGSSGQLLVSGGTAAPTWIARNSLSVSELGTPTADISNGGFKLTNVANGVAATDAATFGQLSSVSAGLDAKASVKAATTANITLSGTQTVDTVALVAADRCLVKNQSTASQNGIWDVSAAGWTRSTDMDVWTEVPGAFTFVEQGTQADTGWVCTADAGGTIASTNMPWAQFSAATSITPGAGLVLNGSAFDVGGTANRITVAADSVDISTAYVGQASITTLGTISTGIWSGTAIGVSAGGTGSTTAAGARTNLAAAGTYEGLFNTALTAGAWSASINHALNCVSPTVSWREASTGENVILDWKHIDANNIQIRSDISRASGFYYITIVG